MLAWSCRTAKLLVVGRQHASKDREEQREIEEHARLEMEEERKKGEK